MRPFGLQPMPRTFNMKPLIATAALAACLALPTYVLAWCYGSEAYQSCYDTNTGNSYTVQRYGDQTFMQGRNSRTGSTWNQNGQTYGNTTFHNGHSSDGNYWNEAQHQLGGGWRLYTGTDSSGQSFSRTCDSYGNCY